MEEGEETTMSNREQGGTIYRKGKMWYLRYSDDRVIDGEFQRKRLAKQIGAIKDLTKKQARDEAERFLGGINKCTLAPETAITFIKFVESVHIPHIEKRVRPSTMRGYRILWNQIKPFVVPMELWIRDIKAKDITDLLDGMGRAKRENSVESRFNITTMGHVKAFLSGVLRFAIAQDYRDDAANPVEAATLPIVREANDTHAYSAEECNGMIAVLPEPARTMVYTATYAGVRRGELRGMRWEDYDLDNKEMRITQSIWNGIATAPKTKKSKAPIAVIGRLAQVLEMHRLTLGSPVSGPIFPNGQGKTAVDPDSVLRRVIKPALKRAGIWNTWHGWHGFRRGLATRLHRLGIKDEEIQRVLRHSTVAVTQKCYIKGADEDAREALRKLESSSNDTFVTPKPAPPKPELVM
jgi:integrase